jgi:phospholipase C
MAHRRVVAGLAAAVCVAGAVVAVTEPAVAHGHAHKRAAHATAVRTPIRHVVVIFQENVSFDHYFGTYPQAANTDGQRFTAASGTPAIDGLLPATSSSLPPSLRHTSNLLTTNPNSALPQRLDSTPTGAAGSAGGQLTCDQDHDYSDEQQAFDKGLMDRFLQSVGTGTGTAPGGTPCQAAQVMDYYDGNTVTGLWNYAQHFSMSDNSYGTTFGPSSPGAINLASGDTGNVDMTHTANNPSISTATSPDGDLTPDGNGGYSLTSDAQPYWDDCSTRDAVALNGQSIGDELNAAGLSWGWFEGGFRPTTTYDQGLAQLGKSGQGTATFVPDEFKSLTPPAHASNEALCDAFHPVGAALGGTGQYGYKDDYIPHHEPFQYYASTANPHHLAVQAGAHGRDTISGLKSIGHDTQSYKNGAPQFNTPNHNYDLSDFNQLVAAITAGTVPASDLPAVSFLKAPGYQDGHAGYSDPEDEQQFITRTINALQRTPDWKNTAVIVAYDDSDGWYDHAFSGVHNPSLSPSDNLTDTQTTLPTSGKCGSEAGGNTPLAGEQGRCGLGPRLPLLVISPYARVDAVDHNLSDQSSILNFVEYNWGLPAISGSADQLLSRADRSEGVRFDLAGLFQFDHRAKRLFLDPFSGQPRGRG